jgi:hypothetical protein
LWPKIAQMMGIACGEPRNIRLVDWMKDKEPVWKCVVERYGLQRRTLNDTALWSFGDFVFRQDWDVLSNLTRLRQTGFAGSVDSVDMFRTQFAQYSAAKMMPPVCSRDA